MSDSRKQPSISRRSLCAGIGGAAAMFALGGTKAFAVSPAVRPPGGQDADQLLSACIRCQMCYEACPHGVIAPAHLEDGFIGARTPVMDFSQDWCNFCVDENNGVPLCASVCPTHALQLETNAKAEEIILGKADLDCDLCLAYRWTGCRFCYDACPYEAIALDEYNRPYIVEERCNGCGACEAACVSLQEGSVSGGTHRRAIIIVPEEESPHVG